MMRLFSILILIGAIGFVASYPISDYIQDYFRRQFIEFCVLSARDSAKISDDTLRACNAAWNRREAVKNNNWQPTTP